MDTKFEEARASVKRLEFDYDVNEFLKNILTFKEKTNSEFKEI